MKPEDAPAELVNLIKLKVGSPLPCMSHDETDDVYREILAFVLPEHEKQVRAKLAEAIADVPEARDDEDPDYVEAYWDGRDDAARIARGES